MKNKALEIYFNAFCWLAFFAALLFWLCNVWVAASVLAVLAFFILWYARDEAKKPLPSLRFKKMGIDLKKAIPAYIFMGKLGEMSAEDYYKKPGGTELTVFFSSEKFLHLYLCLDNTYDFKKDKAEEDIASSLLWRLLKIPKEEITAIEIHQFILSPAAKKKRWVEEFWDQARKKSHRVLKYIYKKDIYCDVTVKIVLQREATTTCYLFGIPEKFDESIGIDLPALIPGTHEDLDKVFEIIEIGEVAEEYIETKKADEIDSMAAQKAKIFAAQIKEIVPATKIYLKIHHE